MVAQFDLADEREHQRAEEQQQFAECRRDKGDYRQDDVGRRRIGAGAVAAEQRGLQLAKRCERLFEYRKLRLDDAADFGSASDPFADRTGHGGHRQGQRPDASCDDQDGGDPGRNAVALGGLDQRRQRQCNHGGGQDRQQDGAAEIEESAEQQQEYADRRGRTGRDPHILEVFYRLRVADDERVADLALGSKIFHQSLRRPRPRPQFPAEVTPSPSGRFPAAVCAQQ